MKILIVLPVSQPTASGENWFLAGRVCCSPYYVLVQGQRHANLTEGRSAPRSKSRSTQFQTNRRHLNHRCTGWAPISTKKANDGIH